MPADPVIEPRQAALFEVRVQLLEARKDRDRYLFQDHSGRPGKGNDKGKVEGLVGYARRNFLVPGDGGSFYRRSRGLG
jgi:hypothetical protein